MKSNIHRREEIFKGVLPPFGTKEYFEAIETIKKRKKEMPEIKTLTKDRFKKVRKSLEVQYFSTCDYITEKTLRYYLFEFNSRAWEHGLRSMPVMFNIMEAFFNYRKPEIYFELIEEENYLISFFDFVDFITSKDFENDKDLIDDNITPDIIYNFNVGKDFEEIKFKNENGDEFIIAGLSIIRRANEINVLMIAGRKKTKDISIDINSLQFDPYNPDKSKLIEGAKETFKTKEIEFEYLDEEEKYIKVLIASRIDIETMTIDARYIAEEMNLMFNIITDEIDGFIDEKGEFLSKELRKSYENSKTKADNFNPIFEVIKLSLYLPYFFNLKEEKIVEELVDTHLKQRFRTPLARRKINDVFGHPSYTKTLYSLDIHNIFSPDVIKLRDDMFRVQTNGYWKKIGINEIGLDKNGKPIHGRTWVNQNLSWFEAKENDLIIEKEVDLYKDANAGFIYIIRNPTMSKNIFKIGLTRNDVNDRVSQLSKTSVPDKFYKAQEWNVKDCILAEKEIHNKLNNYRVDPRREFFNVDYDEAIKVIKEVVEQINKE